MKRNKDNCVKRMLSLILSMALMVTSFAVPVRAEELAEIEPVVSIAEDAGEVSEISANVSNMDILEEGSDVISSDEEILPLDDADADLILELSEEDVTDFSDGDTADGQNVFLSEESSEESQSDSEESAQEDDAIEMGTDDELDSLSPEDGLVIEDIEMEAETGLVAEAVEAASASAPHVISSAHDYIANSHSESGYAYGNEWLVYAQLRAGNQMDQSVLNSYYASVSNTVKNWSANQKPTDLERVALALTAMGKDITNVEGVNLAAMIYNHPGLASGSNELIYALVALDAADITIPADAKWNRSAILAELVKYQNTSNGGFGLSDNLSTSVDMTAMALQALVNYQNRPEVKAATEKALKYLRDRQQDDFGYGNAESTAQVLLALSLLGIDSTSPSSGFGTPNFNMITNLMEDYHTGEGGFSHLPGTGKSSEMSTVQVLHALDAYQMSQEGGSYWNLNGVKAEVSFALLGDQVHDSDADHQTHTLMTDNLQTWIPASDFRIPESSTVYDVFRLALTANKMTWINKGNYISSITGNGIELAEFTNGKKSGWMYTLNGIHPELGVEDQQVKDGDVIVFHYTDNYSKEYPHEHQWTSVWSCNSTSHWHECKGMMGECSATENSQKAGYGTHTPGDWIIDDAVTGAKHKECTVCGYVTETVEGHTCSWDNGTVTKKPTCTEKGVKTYKCSCGKTKTESIPADGHKFSTWKTTAAATVFKAKQQKRTCSVCGQTETRSVGKKLTQVLEIPGKLSSFQIKTGETEKFALTMAAGDSLKSVKSSKPEYVKVVSCDKKKGTVTLKAVKKGTSKITIKLASSKSRTYTVKAVTGTVKTTKVTVADKEITLKTGKTTTLKPVLTPLTSTQKITYKSSNTKAATVTSKGKIKAVSPGTARITVTSGSKTASVTVTVPGIGNVKSSAELKKGKSLTLKPKLYGVKGTVTYKSSNTKIAAVTSKGKIKGIKKGTATITVKAGSYSVKCKVKVQ